MNNGLFFRGRTLFAYHHDSAKRIGEIAEKPKETAGQKVPEIAEDSLLEVGDGGRETGTHFYVF